MLAFAVDQQTALVEAGDKPTVTPGQLAGWVGRLLDFGEPDCAAIGDKVMHGALCWLAGCLEAAASGGRRLHCVPSPGASWSSSARIRPPCCSAVLRWRPAGSSCRCRLGLRNARNRHGGGGGASRAARAAPRR